MGGNKNKNNNAVSQEPMRKLNRKKTYEQRPEVIELKRNINKISHIELTKYMDNLGLSLQGSTEEVKDRLFRHIIKKRDPDAPYNWSDRLDRRKNDEMPLTMYNALNSTSIDEHSALRSNLQIQISELLNVQLQGISTTYATRNEQEIFNILSTHDLNITLPIVATTTSPINVTAAANSSAIYTVTTASSVPIPTPNIQISQHSVHNKSDNRIPFVKASNLNLYTPQTGASDRPLARLYNTEPVETRKAPKASPLEHNINTTLTRLYQ